MTAPTLSRVPDAIYDLDPDWDDFDQRPRRRFRWWRGALLTIVVVGFAALMVHEYVVAQHALQKERAALAGAKAMNARAATAFRAAVAHTNRLKSERTRTTALDVRARSTTAGFVRGMAKTNGSIASVRHAINGNDIALYAVTTNANEVNHCLDGVARAIAAVSARSSGTAVLALNTSATDCSKAFALSTGAAFPYDFADPYVLRVNGEYYAYSTNSGVGNIQVLSSSDLESWRFAGNALPHLPAWADRHVTWAPAVVARPYGYVAYYTVRDAATGQLCISRASAHSPVGPFVDTSTGPLVCQALLGGSIDASPYVDGAGKAWLVWRSNGVPATIWSQPLTPNGLNLTGTPTPLISANRSFEHGVVEGPSMFAANGRVYLLYSANNWQTSNYAEAFAVCAGPAGPCSKPSVNFVLTSNSKVAGPGGAEVFSDTNGDRWIAFHAYSPPNVGYPHSRFLHLARLRVVAGRPIADLG